MILHGSLANESGHALAADKARQADRQQHGDRWEVLKVQERVLFSDQAGPWMHVTPITEVRIHHTAREAREDTASRWIHAHFDDNFKVAP